MFSITLQTKKWAWEDIAWQASLMWEHNNEKFVDVKDVFKIKWYNSGIFIRKKVLQK